MANDRFVLFYFLDENGQQEKFDNAEPEDRISALNGIVMAIGDAVVAYSLCENNVMARLDSAYNDAYLRKQLRVTGHKGSVDFVEVLSPQAAADKFPDMAAELTDLPSPAARVEMHGNVWPPANAPTRPRIAQPHGAKLSATVLRGPWQSPKPAS